MSGHAFSCGSGGCCTTACWPSLCCCHCLTQQKVCNCYCVCRHKRLRQLLCDSGVAFLVVLLHGGVIMCQGMAFSVAMNSKRGNALVALLIAANFVEIKGAHESQLVQIWFGQAGCHVNGKRSKTVVALPASVRKQVGYASFCVQFIMRK